MGWERKRGKLLELNRLLRGATDTTFMVDPDVQAALRDVKICDHAGFRHAAAACRGAGDWPARWPIRLTGRTSTKQSAASRAATASCSRA